MGQACRYACNWDFMIGKMRVWFPERGKGSLSFMSKSREEMNALTARWFGVTTTTLTLSLSALVTTLAHQNRENDDKQTWPRISQHIFLRFELEGRFSSKK